MFFPSLRLHPGPEQVTATARWWSEDLWVASAIVYSRVAQDHPLLAYLIHLPGDRFRSTIKAPTGHVSWFPQHIIAQLGSRDTTR